MISWGKGYKFEEELEVVWGKGWRAEMEGKIVIKL